MDNRIIEEASLFSSSTGMWLLTFVVSYLCVNGFVNKVLDKQIDRVARFALGFFMLVSGILLAQTNILAGMTWMDTESVVFKLLARFWMMIGLSLCIQSMLSDAGKRYWVPAILGVIVTMALAFLVYYLAHS